MRADEKNPELFIIQNIHRQHSAQAQREGSRNHMFSAQVVFIVSVERRVTSAFRDAGFAPETIEHSDFFLTSSTA